MYRTAIFAIALISSTAAVSASPRQFLGDAIKGDNSEVTLGRLIASRGHSAQVRSYGQTLARDHSLARSQAAAVARRFRMTPPTSMMPEARAEYHKLLRMRGWAFDREVRQYMINDHHKDISDFRKQVHSGNRWTSDLARRQLPTLEKHLRLAQSIRA